MKKAILLAIFGVIVASSTALHAWDPLNSNDDKKKCAPGIFCSDDDEI